MGRGGRKSFLVVLSLFSLGSIVACETISEPDLVYGAPEHDVLEILPYRVDERNRMIIDVNVNDRGPYPFIIDTGASLSLVYEHLRKELGLTFTEEETLFVHGAVLSQRRPVLPIKSIRIGSLDMQNVQSFSLPNPIVTEGDLPGGILGLDFLARYALYVDIEEQVIVFAKSGYLPSKRRYASVPIIFDDLGILRTGIPIIQAKVSGKPVEALLDLGAEQTIINWAAAESFGVNVKKFLRGKHEFEGIFDAIPVTAGARGAVISVGDRYWPEMTIDIANLPIFTTMNRGEKPAILISAGLLREENFIIDFPQKLFFLEASKQQRLKDRSEKLCVDSSFNGPLTFCEGSNP